jgi:hypothetical protein
MPIEDYSHMVMDNKHMVDGYGGGNDGDEEALKITPLQSGEQDPTASKNKDRDGGGALDLIKLCPYGNRVFSHI